MKTFLAIAGGCLFWALTIVLCGHIGKIAGPHGKLADEIPEPSGPFVDDPNSGKSYNLADYEKIAGRKITAFREPPLLRGRVRAGQLPPVAQRLPDNPLVMVPWERIGRYGGKLRYTEFTISYDHYLRHLNQAALLEQEPQAGVAVCFKWTEGHVQPGVLEHWSHNDDATEFTLRIRCGLRWSDGTPVTTEDVKYCVEDVLLNPAVMPVLPQWAKWGGGPLRLDVVDKHTFRLTFRRSYGLFAHRLATMRWGNLMMPKHFLKAYHRKYTPIAAMKPLMDRDGYGEKDWPRFYLKITGGLASSAGSFVPERHPPGGGYPTLDPWVHVRQPNPGDYILERNPYFYKIDPEGNQLPYIDTLARTFVSDIQIENLKILSGETDVQFQFIRLSDYPLFKRSERGGNYHVMLLPAWQDYMLVYPINMHTADPVIRPILGDARFRRALSMALNREEIKEAMFLGMGRPAQMAPLPGSPWYREEFATAAAKYDPVAAAGLLDEMGLRWDADHKFRLTSKGEKLTVRIDYYDVSPTSAPGAELAKAYWEDIGIRTRVTYMDGSRFWRNRGAGQNQVTVWWGDGASPAAESFVSGFLMTQPWQQYFDTDGRKGTEPPGWAKEVVEKRQLMYASPDPAVRRKAAIRIFEVFSEHIWTIGAVADVPVPFVYSRKLGNISVGRKRRLYHVTVGEAAEQWFFKE